jgi:transcriptional regulator with XRE-family HTH domain
LKKGCLREIPGTAHREKNHRRSLSFRFRLPDPPHILKKRNQLLKRKVGIAKLGRVALFFEGDDVAGENRPKFGRPAFGAAAAEQLANLLTIGEQARIRGFRCVCFCVHWVGLRSVEQMLPYVFRKARIPPTSTQPRGPVTYAEIAVNYPKTSRRIYINCHFNEIAFCMTHTTSNPKIHEGRNVKRFREMLGIKQEFLAFELGSDWNQQRISVLEQREKIDSDILEQVSAILKIPVEAIRNFDEEKAVNVISNTFNDSSMLNAVNNNPTFHPIDKLVQLHEEKIALYERMLKEKDEMMGRLERLMESK